MRIMFTWSFTAVGENQKGNHATENQLLEINALLGIYVMRSAWIILAVMSVRNDNEGHSSDCVIVRFRNGGRCTHHSTQ